MIRSLPPELLIEVAAYLDLRSLCNIVLVSRTLNTVATSFLYRSITIKTPATAISCFKVLQHSKRLATMVLYFHCLPTFPDPPSLATGVSEGSEDFEDEEDSHKISAIEELFWEHFRPALDSVSSLRHFKCFIKKPHRPLNALFALCGKNHLVSVHIFISPILRVAEARSGDGEIIPLPRPQLPKLSEITLSIPPALLRAGSLAGFLTAFLSDHCSQISRMVLHGYQQGVCYLPSFPLDRVWSSLRTLEIPPEDFGSALFPHLPEVETLIISITPYWLWRSSLDNFATSSFPNLKRIACSARDFLDTRAIINRPIHTVYLDGSHIIGSESKWEDVLCALQHLSQSSDVVREFGCCVSTLDPVEFKSVVPSIGEVEILKLCVLESMPSRHDIEMFLGEILPLLNKLSALAIDMPLRAAVASGKLNFLSDLEQQRKVLVACDEFINNVTTISLGGFYTWTRTEGVWVCSITPGNSRMD